MSIRGRNSLTSPIAAVVLVALVLSGCSAGASSFGNNKLDVAEISNINEYDAEGALSQARAQFRNGNYGHSATLYKRVVELQPSNAEGYVGLSASYDRLRRFDLSDRVYASLFKLSGGTAQYYNNLGYSHLLRGDLTAALRSFRQAEKLSPDSVIIQNNILLVQDAQRQA